MTKTVLGIFENRLDAEAAVDDLKDIGYKTQDISIMMRDSQPLGVMQDSGTAVADSTVSGAVTGGVIGGIAGLLIGIGAIAVPGIGALLIGGPLAAALGATGVAATTVSGAATGVLAGGIIGALVGLGIPQEDAKVYEESIKKGGILVAVPVLNDQEQEVEALLEDNGAQQIRSVETAFPESEEEIHSYTQREFLYAPVGIKGGKARVGKTVPKKTKHKSTHRVTKEK